MARATTPQDLIITPRDRRFGRGMRQDRWWMGGDPVATAYYNALSATFPKGEAYFVESVRMFRDGTPAKLAGEIKAFVTQEVMHSREHVQFNKRALEAGYDMSGLEARAWARMLWFAWVRPGMMRKILGAWLAFFLPGFHPWNQDDRALIASEEVRLQGQGEAYA